MYKALKLYRKIPKRIYITTELYRVDGVWKEKVNIIKMEIRAALCPHLGVTYTLYHASRNSNIAFYVASFSLGFVERDTLILKITWQNKHLG